MPDTLPPVDSLSDEEFDKAFEQLEAIEYSEDNGGSEEKTTEPSEDNTEDNTEENIEHPTDSDSNEDETTDEPAASEEEGEDQEDSINDEGNEDEQGKDEAKTDEAFSFDDIPMDVELPFEIAANGMKTKATLNQLITGFQKGLNYTKHMQQLKPFRTSIGIMEENDLSDEDLNLLIELKSGNKEALNKLLSDIKIDPLDLEQKENSDYTPKNYGKDIPDPEMEQVIGEIKNDADNFPIMQEALNSMPQDFYDVVSANPGGMKSLYEDVKSGVYEKVMPEVMKLQALYGPSDTMKMYVETARRLLNEGGSKEKEPSKDEAKPNKQNKDAKRKLTSTTKKKNSGTKPVSKQLDDLTDDEFDEEFKRMFGDVDLS